MESRGNILNQIKRQFKRICYNLICEFYALYVADLRILCARRSGLKGFMR
eukprot:UN01691